MLIVKSNKKEIPVKPLQNLMKPWQKSKTTYFYSRVDKVVTVVMIGDE
jgi:hypothetical protein